MYKVILQKIFFLALEISAHYNKSYYNTNDLVKLANQFKTDLVRIRSDKKDYKYLDDTKFGGLRGNFSTLLTLKGFVKRGNKIIPFYSLGMDGRIVNAVNNGEIILDSSDLSANTTNERLKNLLEQEVYLSKVRENQAHIKVMLKKNSVRLGINRDNIFKKDSVVVSSGGQYFLRGLLNNFVNNNTIEYNLYNYWSGKKIIKKNMHLLISIPTKDNSWAELYAIKFEDLIKKKPMYLMVSMDTKNCIDRLGNIYTLYSLEQAKNEFSDGNANINERLIYKWKDLISKESSDEVEIQKEVKQQETWVFVDKFLKFKKTFSIDSKDVIEYSMSSSGGCDVILKYSGGTTQKLELEHDWKNYIDHKHPENNAWSNAWLFAEQEWNPSLIVKLFKPLKVKHGNRVPDVFLCFENSERKAYKADWGKETFTEINLTF
ncbi:MAG: hypothetical protein A2541_01940 [Candidatus Taylorbacteria bacterium RIFOXYD2_FULL_36_9]|uniref:Uncharacterized protein n=1 Tax=Candidatus Taylorbacteria bacterium RIFOXYD2_FULL_36_9 TaxID=1802338 RepID=A0A1G2PGT7_9BACT|nr:MAG: hypothetical protein A2541_01940 [Candidatus Taylorbacteria bacterium RIFOXYD2_FULL_36_9]